MGRKTHQHLIPRATLHHLVQQVRNHFPTRWALQDLLQLLLAELAAQGLPQTLISHSSRHHHRCSTGLMALQQLLQFSGRAKPLAVQPFEQPRLQLQRTVQQANLGPAPAGRLGQQHPHQPGGWIAQNTGRIEELLGGPGCDQQLHPLEITLNPMHRQGGCRLQQQARLHHPAAAAPITGQQTFRSRRQSQQRAITLQLLPIALHRRRFPHVGVHRCRREHWGPGGHQRGGQQGVSQAMH